MTLIGLSVSKLTTDHHPQRELPIDGGDVARAGGKRTSGGERSMPASIGVRDRLGRDTLTLGTSGLVDDDFRRLDERS